MSTGERRPQMSLGRSAAWRALARGRWRPALALLAGAALLAVRAPRSYSLAADFPHHSPKALAHFLADFSNHPRLYSHISTGSWEVLEESNNYTSWSYEVAYECGARYAGRVALSAHDAGAAHRLRVRDESCTRLPLLPWPQMCDNMETETVITARRGGGARLVEAARARCGLLALAAACDVRAARQRHLRALRDALAQDS